MPEGGPFLPLIGGTVTGPVAINYPYPSAATAFSVQLAHNNATPTMPTLFAVHAGTGGSVTSAPSPPNYFAFYTDSDNLDAEGAGGIYNFGSAINVQSGGKGDRVALYATVHQSQAMPAGTAHRYLVAGYLTASASENGGGTSVPDSRGAVLGINPLAQLGSGATYFQGLAAAEFNVNAMAGSSVQYKTGISIIQGGGSAVQGSAHDIAMLICSNPDGGTAAGWKYGLSFGTPLGWWNIDPTGTLIGAMTPSLAGGPAYQAAWGIDFSAVTFSGGLIRGPGFSVDGAGRVSPLLFNAANDAAAAAGGVPVGAMYRNGSVVMVRVV
jgi:hypothetical protein